MIVRGHNERCRNRIRELLLTDDFAKDRVQAATIRLKRTRDQQGDVDMRGDQDEDRLRGESSVEPSVVQR